MNVFNVIAMTGDEGPFAPRQCKRPTDAPPGSSAKIVALMKRVERGEELWHEDDKDNCEGAQPHEIRRGPSNREPAIREMTVRSIYIQEDDWE